jgi:hemerythrin superfamily protein
VVRGAPHPPTERKTVENTAPRTMKAADAVDLLTDDHLQVSALFKQYEKLAKRKAPADQRRTLAATICDMLKAHTTIEEELLYPAARKARVETALLDEADIEHASAKDLIAQIESGSPDDDHFDARVKVLGEYITHHVVEEHTEMFPKCRRANIDLVALRARMEARKAEFDSGGAAIAEEGVPQPMAASAESAGILSRISDSLFSAKNP